MSHVFVTSLWSSKGRLCHWAVNYSRHPGAWTLVLPELSFLVQGLGAEFSKSYYYYNQAGHMCQCLVYVRPVWDRCSIFFLLCSGSWVSLGWEVDAVEDPKPWQSIRLLTVANNLNMYATPSSTCTGLFYVIGWIPLLSLFRLRKQAY